MTTRVFTPATHNEITEVRYRGWAGPAVAAGVLGLALGAAAASQPYYGPPPAYYEPQPVYPYSYGYGAPVYRAPAPYYQGYRDHNSGGNW